METDGNAQLSNRNDCWCSTKTSQIIITVKENDEMLWQADDVEADLEELRCVASFAVWEFPHYYAPRWPQGDKS